MADPYDDPAMWPVSPYALVDTQLCPACFSRLPSTTCASCGLVLADERATRLLDLGHQMLALESDRQRLIDELRLAHQGVREPVAVAAPAPVAVPEPISVAVPRPVAVPEPISVAVAASGAAAGAEPVELPAPPPHLVLPEPAMAPVAAPRPAADNGAAPPEGMPAPAPRRPLRRLTVPVLLLIVGVSLVGVAAVFFLVFAWFVADVGMRALIIGGVTLTAMVAASLLRLRSLTATAEGIAVLGVILLALDAWGVRANDLFGAGGMDPVVYAGLATFIVGAVCRVWSLVSRLRGPDLAATLALPTGLGLLIAGLLPLETSGAITAGLLGTAAGGLAHALPAPWSAARSRPDSVPERTGLAVIGGVALVASALMLLFGLESMAVQLVAAASVVVLGVAHAFLLRARADGGPLPGARAIAGAAGAVAAAAAASLGWQMAAQSTLPVYAELIAPVTAVVVAVTLDRWHPRSREHLAARIAAAVVGGVSIGVLVVGCALRGAQFAGERWILWDTPVFAPPLGFDSAAGFAAVAASVIAVLLFFAPTLEGSGLSDARAVIGSFLVIIGALGTGIPIVVEAVAIAVGVIAIAALARGAGRAGWGVAAALAALTAFLAGLVAPWLWAVGVLVAIGIPIAARAVVRPKAIAAVLLALAPVAVSVAAAFIAPLAIAAAFDIEADAAAALVLLQWVAVFALACAVALPLDSASRSGLAISSQALLLVSLLALASASVADGTVSAAIAEPVAGVLRTSAMLVLLASVTLGRTGIRAGSGSDVAALGAAALLAPTAACVAIAVVKSFGVTEDGWAGFAAVCAAVVVVWAGALMPARAYTVRPAEARGSSQDGAAGDAVVAPAEAAPRAFAMLARRAADAGALATAVLATVSVPADLRWALLAVIATGFAGASVTPGWAGVSGIAGVPETRSAGVASSAAPRRLLVWAAWAAATPALWLWLDDSGSFEIELFVLPPAIGLLLFAGVLVWLRRHAEATVAVVLSFTLGLVVPAIVGTDGSPTRGTVVATVAAALALVLACTPIRRVRIPALAGVTVALVALAIVAVGRAFSSPPALGWLLLLVGVAYVSSYGFIRGSHVRAAAAAAPASVTHLVVERLFAAIAPTTALAVAAVSTIPSLDQPFVIALALAIPSVLHLAAAALDAPPLGPATRWTALGAAIVVGAQAHLLGETEAIELVSLPIAGVLLGGAALAMWRRARADRPWPGEERFVWLAGLALAVVPSIVAPPNDPRTWLVVVAALLAAIGCVVASIADEAGLKTPSALILSAGALAMGARVLFAPAVESGELAAICAGAGALAVAATMVSMSDADSPPPWSTALGAAGAALLLLTVGVHADGELAWTSNTAAGAGAIGVGGAALLRWRRWAGIGLVLAVGGLVAAVIAIGGRFAVVAAQSDAGVEPDLWALAAVGIIVAIGVMALRSTESKGVAGAVGVTFSFAIVLFATAEVLLLGGGSGDQARTLLTMIALTGTGIVGVLWRQRLGVPLALTSAVLTAIVGLVALTVFAVRPIELVTVPPALGMLILGARALRTRVVARTWPTLGPGLLLLTIPSLAYDFGETTLWRVVALGVVAIGMVVAGAIWRLQAPLLLGSVVLLLHAVAQLWPWVSAAYVAVPWWLWLGLGGALLIFLAATYERRMRDLRAAFTAVTSLR